MIHNRQFEPAKQCAQISIRAQIKYAANGVASGAGTMLEGDQEQAGGFQCRQDTLQGGFQQIVRHMHQGSDQQDRIVARGGEIELVKILHQHRTAGMGLGQSSQTG